MNTEHLKSHLEAIKSSPEQKFLREIHSLRSSYNILLGNYSELLKPLQILEDKPEALSLWNVNKKQELYNVFEDLGRLLFNFLSAAFMLIDHTRNFVNRHYANNKYGGFKEEYEEEITTRFVDDEMHQIAQGLRNYIIHWKLPDVGSSITYTKDSGLNKAFMISTSSLLEWDGWKAKAKTKLNSLGKVFHLRWFIKEYFSRVTSFHQWLWTKQKELHKADFDRLNELKGEAQLAFKETGLLTDDEINQLNRGQIPKH